MATKINLQWIVPPQDYPPPQISLEQYGTGTNAAGNTTLQWIIYMHDDTPRPMGLVLHIGEYKYGAPGPQLVARDLYYAGYNSAAVAYRLADPGSDMRGVHGDQPLGDHGIYPEQTDDVSQAVIAARTGSTPRTAGMVTGDVFAVGGSAGGSHAAHLAGATVHGGDKLDAAVCLSGSYNFQLDSPPGLGNDPNADYRNYCGCTVGTACDDVGGIRDLASPYHQFSAASSPVYLLGTNNDPIRYWQREFMTAYLTSVGATWSGRLLTEAQFQTNGATRHAFQYWIPQPGFPDEVATESIAWLQGLIPPPPAP